MKLKKIRNKRGLHRKRRIKLGFSLVSLAGYTNAGKSSIFNVLVDENVTVDSGLFTTLTTTTRAVKFDGKNALITDTVGFIDRLPLALIESFQSTLEETIFSDVILLVLDLSESIPNIHKKLNYCLDTIRELGAMGIPLVTALNKIDLLTAQELEKRIVSLKDLAPNPIIVSAKEKTNLDDLRREVSKHLENFVTISFLIPINKNTLSLIYELYDRVDNLEIKYENNKAELNFSALPSFTNKIMGRVEKLEGQILDVKRTKQKNFY